MRSETDLRATRAAELYAAVLLLLAAAPVRAAVVERILAVVDGRPVLLSEVAVFEKVRGEGERQALEGLIDEQLMYREAARLPQATLTAAEEERAFESLLSRVAAATADEQEQLRRLARRQAAILKYIDFRFRPQVRVSDEAVRAAYEAEARGDAASFEQVAPALRARLAEEDLSRRIEGWVKELRQSAEIRYNEMSPSDRVSSAPRSGGERRGVSGVVAANQPAGGRSANAQPTMRECPPRD